MSNYKVKSNVSMSKVEIVSKRGRRTGNSKYPFNTMEMGDSFEFDQEDRKKVFQAAFHYKQSNPEFNSTIKDVRRKKDGKIVSMLWRIEPVGKAAPAPVTEIKKTRTRTASVAKSATKARNAQKKAVVATSAPVAAPRKGGRPAGSKNKSTLAKEAAMKTTAKRGGRPLGSKNKSKAVQAKVTKAAPVAKSTKKVAVAKSSKKNVPTATPKRGGRPLGSKNKVKAVPAVPVATKKAAKAPVAKKAAAKLPISKGRADKAKRAERVFSTHENVPSSRSNKVSGSIKGKGTRPRIKKAA